MERIILHIDVNSAFLAWTAVALLQQNNKVDIRKIAAVIGGDEEKRHGIVLAKSDLAKAKGIITGESLYQARKKCPTLKVFPPQRNLYQTMSNRLFNLIKTYTSAVEIFSVDECFVDYSKLKHKYGDPFSFCQHLKAEIKTKLGFTVNIGIGTNKLTAKMASNFKKPDQVHTLFPAEIKTKMWPLPVIELFGVGPKTNEKLKILKIKTIKDLAHADQELLIRYFKKRAPELKEKALGIDYSPVITKVEITKGMSQSVTLPTDLKTKTEVLVILKQLINQLSYKLRKQKRYAKVIAVILKDNEFKTYSKQQKLLNATNLPQEIYKTSHYLLNKMWTGQPVRLVGIRFDQLNYENSYQLSLFENETKRQQEIKLKATIDHLKDKFGDNIVMNLSSLKKQ